jgi:hypothetical protein
VKSHIEHVAKSLQQYLSQVDTQYDDEKANSNEVTASKLA